MLTIHAVLFGFLLAVAILIMFIALIIEVIKNKF